jgi:hypothetical protein
MGQAILLYEAYMGQRSSCPKPTGAADLGCPSERSEGCHPEAERREGTLLHRLHEIDFKSPNHQRLNLLQLPTPFTF